MTKALVAGMGGVPAKKARWPQRSMPTGTRSIALRTAFRLYTSQAEPQAGAAFPKRLQVFEFRDIGHGAPSGHNPFRSMYQSIHYDVSSGSVFPNRYVERTRRTAPPFPELDEAGILLTVVT